MKWWWILVGLVILLFLIRLVLPSQLDDVNPLINCSEKELELADVYFVVPKFNGVDISKNKEWCEQILKKDKELAMHGVYHNYKEFEILHDEDYFNEGMNIFQNCFGFMPERFKPGNLAWTSENNWIKNEIEIDLFWNQVFHKVYHCNDSGRFPNWLIRIY